MTLTKDVKNPRPKRGRGDVPSQWDVIPRGLPFVTEAITSRTGGGKAVEEIVAVDEESYHPLEAYKSTDALFKTVRPHLRRAAPSAARVLVENDLWADNSVWNILDDLVSAGAVSLTDLKRVVKEYRRRMDADNQDRDDLVRVG